MARHCLWPPDICFTLAFTEGILTPRSSRDLAGALPHRPVTYQVERRSKGDRASVSRPR